MAGAQGTVTLVEGVKEEEAAKKKVELEELDKVPSPFRRSKKNKDIPESFIRRERRLKRLKRIKKLAKQEQRELLRQRSRIKSLRGGAIGLEEILGKPTQIPKSKFKVGLDGRPIRKASVKFKSEAINNDIKSAQLLSRIDRFANENLFGNEQIFVDEGLKEKFFPSRLRDI